MASTKTQPGQVMSPSKLAHVVLKTNKFEHMKRFYVNFLGGKVVHSNDYLAFITYDEEHHRIGLVNIPGTTNKVHESAGLVHVAFSFDSLKDLCTAYKQRKEFGIAPGWCVNHGPTTSMYYQDPDGNQIETQVDNFDDPDEATALMSGPLFEQNAIGTDYDPEELCAAVDRGEDESFLKIRKEMGFRGAEAASGVLEQIRNAPVGA